MDLPAAQAVEAVVRILRAATVATWRPRRLAIRWKLLQTKSDVSGNELLVAEGQVPDGVEEAAGDVDLGDLGALRCCRAARSRARIDGATRRTGSSSLLVAGMGGALPPRPPGLRPARSEEGSLAGLAGR
jgi:hypothetical protein